MADDWPTAVDLAAYVRAIPATQLKSQVPPPVVVRLDQLVELLLAKARELGDVTHAEVLAALIQNAPTEPKRLARVVTAYRWTKVHSTLLDAHRKTGTYPMPPRRIGRPSTKRR